MTASLLSLSDYAQRILTARVYDVAIESPLDPMSSLSNRIGRPVFLKREDLQSVFSFKLRGAYNKIVSLEPASRARGVICASAGNHAQGVALAAQKLGIQATIVMPRTTPAIKIGAVKRLGGNVILDGDTFDDAQSRARELENEHHLTFVHPFDDPDVIAGQGTIGLEILRQHPDPIEAVFVPIGGGGLAAGVAAFVKFLRPSIKIIGVEPSDAASMAAAIAHGEVVALDQVGLFADGVAVRKVGLETFRLCRDLLDEIITVDVDAMCASIKDIYDDTRSIAEPSGALALAGLKVYAERQTTRVGSLIAVNSGANLNFDRLRTIADRAEVGEHREALLAVTVPEKPGSYRRFIRILGSRAVTEFNYRFADGSMPAQLFVGIALSGGEAEKKEVIDYLEGEGYPILDLSDNELAKAHVRYMVGGRAPHLENELIYRFEFPERPGALLRFLESLAPEWNISLFHYRNHGADYGRILAGVEVSPDARSRFVSALDSLGYPYWDETDNPAYRMFLSARNISHDPK
ncbi:threonine ammonia-lyase, biosynthetic [Mesorhizobium waimense]|uniref:L-threonine dehydratase n=1 Tax=Mesorhizobium waimense TaxID=1300307 RepID=A0A3A5LAX6_9HYPH|nr:threonine ammonia-lyase, biosynthetic [Mesorhizobium waimense]RJT41439.1 threonine ammonia-lyase, biosynthetic [Mesorhizobium waimense]